MSYYNKLKNQQISKWIKAINNGKSETQSKFEIDTIKNPLSLRNKHMQFYVNFV